MIVVTGAAGFIGSCMVNKLNNKGFSSLVVVDDFSREDKMKNLQGKAVSAFVHRNDFFSWFDENHDQVEAVYHLGARTDTTETDTDLLNRLNLFYSQAIFMRCAGYGIPLVYASSAAVYGDGSLGYSDSHGKVPFYQPLNAYGVSKNEFDKWVMYQVQTPPFWAGVRFFNVYGPNEYHKGRMASVVLHAFRQIEHQGMVKLFRSHRPDFSDGEQLRDFVYVKDVVSVLHFLMTYRPSNGIYNLGTGKARSFNSLVQSVFNACGRTPQIEYIDTPEDIRDKYQYFTEADMDKLLKTGYSTPFHSLEEGVYDYVKTYLTNGYYY
ncbi:MAG TPA: ADP-glyceromanno-heptose 6-epimerase [Bacteroidales bacterium]|nr:ADP-glyceromanno-heptose 6-epimerase [Bacteroidales bacterium]HRZ48929.1 ADP-glyceromanno-heptose 6-epimerase [Bacteroidales bacterium]